VTKPLLAKPLWTVVLREKARIHALCRITGWLVAVVLEERDVMTVMVEVRTKKMASSVTLDG